jgi:hypothetical protein
MEYIRLKPWNEFIVIHPEVLNGMFQQSEFAADLAKVLARAQGF